MIHLANVLNQLHNSFDHFRTPNNKEFTGIQTLGIGSSAISSRIVEGKRPFHRIRHQKMNVKVEGASRGIEKRVVT